MKKIFSVLLSLVLLAACIVTPAYAQPAPTSGACGESAVWAFDPETKTLTISGSGAVTGTGVKDKSGIYFTPWAELKEQVERLVVEEGITTVCNNAFYGFTALKSAELADSITDIGSYCFADCASLETVNLPKSLTRMSCTFEQCASLRQVMAIPEAVTEMYGPFGGTQISTVVLPKSMRGVPQTGLYGTRSLKTLLIPAGIESIGVEALAHTGIRSLIVPATVKELGGMMCVDCTELEYVSLPDGIKEIPRLAFCNGQGALKHIRLPGDLETIERDAFYNAGFSEITIPASVTKICEGAFALMENVLTDVWFTGTEEQWNAIGIEPEYNEALLNATVHFNAPPEAPHLAGDVNGDGAVTAEDARLALRAAVELDEYEVGGLIAVTCDADMDGSITASDARLTLRAAVGLETLS